MELQEKKRVFATVVFGILLVGMVVWPDHDDRESIQPIQTLEEEGMVVLASTGPDGSVAYGGENGKIYMQNVEQSTSEPTNWTVSEHRITALEWIPGTDWLLWGDTSGLVGTFDPDSTWIRSEQLHHGAVNAMVFLGSGVGIEFPDHPDTPASSDPTGSQEGSMQGTFAIGSDDASVSIIAIGQGMEIDQIESLNDAGYPIRDLALSPDGQMLAIGGLGQEVIVYETMNWTIEQMIPTPAGSWVTALAWYSKSEPVKGSDTPTDLIGIALSSRKMEWYNATDWEWNATTNLSSWATDTLSVMENGVLVLGGMDGNLTILNTDKLNETLTIPGEEPIVSLGEGSGSYEIAAADSNGTLRFRHLGEAVETVPPIVEPEVNEEEAVDESVHVRDRSEIDWMEVLYGILIFMPIVLSLFVVSVLASRHEQSPSRIPVARAVRSEWNSELGEKGVGNRIRNGTENRMGNGAGNGIGNETGNGVGNGMRIGKNGLFTDSVDPAPENGENGTGGSKVVNIYIRDSVINRSNLLMEEDRENGGEEYKVETYE